MTRIIAIDPSLTSTAVAHGRDAQPTVELWKPKTKGTPRLAEFQQRVGDLVRGDRFDAVAYIEGYSYGSHNKAHDVGELGGVLRLAFHNWYVPLAVVSPSTLKKFASGNGNASKALVVSSVASRTGLTFDTDDAADALALYCLGRELHGLEHPMGQLPKTHLSALDTLRETDDA